MAMKDEKLEDKPKSTDSIEVLKVIIATVEKLSEADRFRVMATACKFFDISIHGS